MCSVTVIFLALSNYILPYIKSNNNNKINQLTGKLLFISYLNQLTSETDPPCFTITAFPEYSRTPSANKLHSHSSTSDAYAATNPAPDAPPALLSPKVPYLSTPSDWYSFPSQFANQSDTFYFPPLSSSSQIPLSSESSKSAPFSSDTYSPSPPKAFYFPVFSPD